MKKRALWLNVLLIFLLLTACNARLDGTEPAEFRVACFGCKEMFSSGQLNADFGLCQDCMIQVGANYCKKCNSPCYARDMVCGLCQNCSAPTEETASIVGGNDEEFCLGCGSNFDTGSFIDGRCRSCWKSTFRCEKCNLPYSVAQVFYSLCFSCQDWSVPRCGFCGKDMTDEGGVSAICKGCDDTRCDECGTTIKQPWDNNGLCDDCHAASQRCIKCGTDSNEYDGYCYYCHPDFGFECVRCGFYYPAHRPADEICPGCKCDECGAILAAEDRDRGLCDSCAGICKSCGSDSNEYDGYCYYCHPDFENGCKRCGMDSNEYDGYCYYCHPDFGYECRICGYHRPEHRPADEICSSCKCGKCGAILEVEDRNNSLCDSCAGED